MISTEMLQDIAKSVKLQFKDNELEIFKKNLTDLMIIAGQIDEIDTPIYDNNIFYNFKFQTLDLLDEPITNEHPKFYRDTLDNMIIVPKFVDKS